LHFKGAYENKVEFDSKTTDAKIQQKRQSSWNLTLYNAAIDL